ncbi:MAG: hypothetical protein ACRDJ0_12150 [Actinomycetota bacterium]
MKLQVAHNVSLNRDGRIHRAGDTFEIERWLELDYVEQVKAPRRKATKKTTKKS